MNKSVKSLLLLSGLALIAGCTSTKKIQRNLNSKSHSMAYLMDSKISDVKNNINVALDTIYFNSNIISDTSIVKKKKSWFIPLVVVYVWHAQLDCSQGKSMFTENIPEFLRYSMMDEVKRSGNFSIDTLNYPDYTVELSIDELKTEGPYISSGFFYFALYAYGYSYSDVAGPAISKLDVSYRLKRGDQVVCSNSFHSQKITRQINRKYTNLNILQQDYAASMVEAVSYNFKNVIELITNDINSYISNKV